MAEGQETPRLVKPTKHPEQVAGYVAKGAPEKLAREIVADKIIGGRRVKKLEELAMVDPLTGAFNRRYFNEELQDAFNLTSREQSDGIRTQIGVLILDLDRFKSVNDRFSHMEGDRVLKLFADSIKGKIREEDVFARLGGEEFGLIIRESHKLTPEDLVKMVDRYRKTIAEKVMTGHVAGPKNESVTTSVGLVLFPNGAHIERPQDLVHCADQALYQAKANGRNQVVKFEGIDDNGTPQFSKVEVSPKG